jgi:hypothetical protein
LFSLPEGTEMFHFPSFPPHALYIQARVTALTDGRVPPFGHPRITARLTAPRGLSRPTTSFIGSWCQGIHRAPLKTCPQRCSHPLFRSQTPTGCPPARPHHPTSDTTTPEGAAAHRGMNADGRSGTPRPPHPKREADTRAERRNHPGHPHQTRRPGNQNPGKKPED